MNGELMLSEVEVEEEEMDWEMVMMRQMRTPANSHPKERSPVFLLMNSCCYSSEFVADQN